MENIIKIRVPNVGDVSNVIVKQISAEPGSHLKKGKSIARLDLGYGLMDVVSPDNGEVQEVFVAVGDKVTKDDILVSLAVLSQPIEKEPHGVRNVVKSSDPSPTRKPLEEIRTEVAVIGGGPGGYTAAFRAADLGKKTVLIERYPRLGGVCLNVGCIPSKALLHVAKIIEDSQQAHKFGVRFGSVRFDLEKMRVWKSDVISQLTNALASLSQKRGVSVLHGVASFKDPNKIEVTASGTVQTVVFEKAIIAAGSSPILLPDLPDDNRIVTSTGALALKEVPNRMLIIGGGVVGLEIATVYHALGSEITVVEAGNQLIPIVDEDLVKPLRTFINEKYKAIYLNTRVASLTSEKSGIKVIFSGEQAIEPQTFDLVLVAVGRRPNSNGLLLNQAGVAVTERGFIGVDRQQRTSVDHIFAIGDIVGEPMLAHKASYEGKIAAEVAAGLQSAYNATVIPFVAYTDPEIAWVGMTEAEAKLRGLDYDKAVYPWSASGRSLTMGRKEGKTKIIFDKESRVVMGAGIVGPNASELIAQMALSIEMGCEAQDLSLTIHPHPTLSESLSLAAELFEGTITDLYLPKQKQVR